jgi:hypothetical protein
MALNACTVIGAGAGFHPHLPGFRYNLLAKSLGATMWFFIFYRLRCVLLVLFVGLYLTIMRISQ